MVQYLKIIVKVQIKMVIFLVNDGQKVNDFESGIGKILYEKGTGKFEKYDDAQCVYAITFLPERDGSFIKSKCKFKDK